MTCQTPANQMHARRTFFCAPPPPQTHTPLARPPPLPGREGQR